MPEWVNQILNAALPAVVTIVTAVAGYVAIVIKNKLTEKLNTETKRQVAEDTVKYIQQVYETLSGKEKLQKALETSVTWLNEKGITITEAEATILIESAIKGFKDSWYNPTVTATAGLLQIGETTTTENETITIEMNEQQSDADSE